MTKLIRRKFAYLLLGISSWFKFSGKVLLSKGIVVDVLTLPGYFIVDCHMIKQTSIKGGFQWETWSLPDQYFEDMNELKYKR
jgi:hypothetical protein